MTSSVSYAPLVEVTSVLVVDDHRVFAELLALRLRRETAIQNAHAACTVEQARAAVARRPPDVVLVDLDLDEGSGLDLIRHLDVLPTRPRVVVLVDHSEATRPTQGLVPQGCGWVSKESPFEDLLHAIDAMRREDGAPHSRQGTEGAEGGLMGSLTERQADVLHCLLAGMTRSQVASRLGLSPHTVRDHVRHLFRILGGCSTPDLLARARADGASEPRRLRVVPGP